MKRGIGNPVFHDLGDGFSRSRENQRLKSLPRRESWTTETQHSRFVVTASRSREKTND